MSNSTWNFDPAHSSVDFRIRHAVISWVRGTFTQWSGDLQFDPENPTAVEVSLDVALASVNTGVEDRDAHLRSADFFDIEQYPTMSFKSHSATAAGGNAYKLNGELTLHGITKAVTFDVTFGGTVVDPWGATRAGFEATTVLDRRDFGLVWNSLLEAGGVLVGDTVEITLELEAIKA